MNKWTDEQWSAITEKNCNILVAAAAGAGKTAVLVERIIKKITDKENSVDIDNLLVVTFTNAAASEMRERVYLAISEILDKGEQSENILKQITLMEKASITTIHSFCLEVIRNNFEAVDIEPGFRIGDETETNLIKMEILSELFEEQYETENLEFVNLLESYAGNRDDQIIQDMVLDLYTFIQSSPWPLKWLDDMVNKLNMDDKIDFSQTIWGKVILDSVELELDGIKNILERSIDILKNASGLEKYFELYKIELININSLIECLKRDDIYRWDKFFNSLNDIEFVRLPRAGKEADSEIQEYVKKIRDDVKESIKKISQKLVNSNSKQIIQELNRAYPSIRYLAKLVEQFTQKYTQKKAKRGIVDFNDLEHYCLDILSDKNENGELIPSKIALKYKEKYEEILVDEYQDSNLVQEIIISMISRVDTGKPNVFMVGDVKQSIYRFRQAKPELFLEKYNKYSLNAGEKFRKILLFKNFRSRKGVIDSVNFVFRQIMSKSVGELDYTNDEALNSGAFFPEIQDKNIVVGGNTEIHLVQTHQDIEDIEEQDIIDNIQCEARVVAKRILEIVKSEEKPIYIYDKNRKEYRRAQFNDIVILLRTTRGWSETFVEELSNAGIPVFADTATGFFKTVEILVMISLLQIIDNPLQDIPLLSVLRSPIVGFTTDELAQIRIIDKNMMMFEVLNKFANMSNEQQQPEFLQTKEKVNKFLNNYKEWREMSLYMSTDKLIWSLYNKTGYYAMVGAMQQGEQRQANLNILFEKAKRFEETSYKGLFNFINFIDKLKNNRGDMGSAKILSEKDNVVRIMSIHKSKGLEFPIVFLSGCGKKFNLQDANKGVIVHQDLGFGPEVVDYNLRVSWPSVPKLAIKEKMKIETISEEMRILYVALTRAREKLIITGSINKIEKSIQMWSEMASMGKEEISPYQIKKGKNYLDWICAAVLRHKDCSDLRKNAPIGFEFNGRYIEDVSRWNVFFANKSDILQEYTNKEGEQDNFFDTLEQFEVSEELSDFSHEIFAKLNWKYKYESCSTIPAKVSVTEIKRQFEMENLHVEDTTLSKYEKQELIIKKPKFLEEKKGLSAAERGTVLHFIMQHLDFKNVDIKGQINDMILKELLTEVQAKSVDISKIHKFLKSDIGRRLLNAKEIYREVPFYIELPCEEIYKDIAQSNRGEMVILQGVIDCYFEEDDDLVLLDYKSDYVSENGSEKIKNKYELQIRYYAKVLEVLTKKNIKDKYIYLFWNGEILKY